jgi:hypothetical protein
MLADAGVYLPAGVEDFKRIEAGAETCGPHERHAVTRV